MLVRELGKLAAVVGSGPLSRSPLWNREAASLTQVDLLAFVRSCRDRGESYEAQRSVDVLIGETIKCMARGQIGKVRYLAYTPRFPVFTSGELGAMLATLSLARGRAILFGLEMDMPVGEVVDLTWTRMRRLEKTPLARAICLGQPRHIKLNYVFWEYLRNGAAAPLFGLADSALEASYGLGYDRLRLLYRDITWVDDDAEVESFWRRFGRQ